jgi:transposase InsO family protein
MYRVLEEQGESRDRRIQRNHRDAVKPELLATRSNEVWSWDITKLLGPQKWVYFHLYVIMDIFSRYVVGWLIADRECKKLARLLIQKSALKHGIQPDQLTLHSDNGPSMTSLTVAQLLDNLGVAKTHNRPYTSNDNPFSESQFKTLKYRPEFPVRFQSISSAEAFCQPYFNWYNKEHYHSGITWLTPESVHFGRGELILQKRYETMQQAFLNDSKRFNNQPPKLQTLPSEVYINPPQTVIVQSTISKNVSGQIA